MSSTIVATCNCSEPLLPCCVPLLNMQQPSAGAASIRPDWALQILLSTIVNRTKLSTTIGHYRPNWALQIHCGLQSSFSVPGFSDTPGLLTSNMYNCINWSFHKHWWGKVLTICNLTVFPSISMVRIFCANRNEGKKGGSADQRATKMQETRLHLRNQKGSKRSPPAHSQSRHRWCWCSCRRRSRPG
jgi:hypothetical protein